MPGGFLRKSYRRRQETCASYAISILQWLAYRLLRLRAGMRTPNQLNIGAYVFGSVQHLLRNCPDLPGLLHSG